MVYSSKITRQITISFGGKDLLGLKKKLANHKRNSDAFGPQISKGTISFGIFCGFFLDPKDLEHHKKRYRKLKILCWKCVMFC